MKDTVFVLARAPRLGTVKRRLAREIGDRAALRFHRATLDRVLRDLAADRRFVTVLAITPDHARIARPRGVAVVPQGRGDLGMRMQRALGRGALGRNTSGGAALRQGGFGRAGRTAVVGCDIPGLRAADVRAGFRALGRAQACFGPAPDGGYWLVALGPRRPARPFAGVRWSTAHALADTLANFAGRRVALLRSLRDVDTAADLQATSGSLF